VAREIEPWLAAGITVVCDRCALSTVAYQAPTASEKQASAAALWAINPRAPSRRDTGSGCRRDGR